MRKKIKKINPETNEFVLYNSIEEASKSIETKMDLWKVQLGIAYALIHHTKAYKHRWEEVDA